MVQIATSHLDETLKALRKTVADRQSLTVQHKCQKEVGGEKCSEAPLRIDGKHCRRGYLSLRADEKAGEWATEVQAYIRLCTVLCCIQDRIDILSSLFQWIYVNHM